MSKFSHEGRLRRQMMRKEGGSPAMVSTSSGMPTQDASRTLERYQHTDVAKRLGYDTMAELEILSQARPDRHSRPIAMPSSLVRLPGRAALALTAPLLPATLMGLVTFLLNVGGKSPYPYSAAPLILGTVVFVLVYAGIVCATVNSLFHQHDAKVLDTYASAAPRRLGQMMCARPLGEIADATTRMKAIAADRRPEMADLRRYALTRFMLIDEIYQDALKTIGTSSPTRFRDQATTAALKVLADVGEQMAVVDRQITQRDDIAARGIKDAFSASLVRIASGERMSNGGAQTLVTADARINRLVDAGRRALQMDTDLVDDAGARIDHLIDVHVPALLDSHAKASRCACLEDLDIVDADLARGIEMVRRSIDEGLRRVRTAAADRLRTEVAFLRARRLEDTLGLDDQA